MLYVLICLCLSLAGAAGLQFFYMAYLERLLREHKKTIAVLERRVRNLGGRLDDAESALALRAGFPHGPFPDLDAADDEVWAEVIEER
jgi:hypothetical protein